MKHEKWNMEQILLSFCFFLFSFGQLGRVSFLRQGINIYLYEIVMVCLLISFFWNYRLKPILSFRLKYTLIFLAYLIFSYLISTQFYPSQQNLIALLYLLRLVAYFIFFIYFLYAIKQIKSSKSMRSNVFIVTIITILTALVQYILYPDLRNIIYAGWDPHLNRMVGLFFEPPISGAIYSLLFFYFLLEKPHLNKPFRTIILFILSVFIMLTYSRGTYIGFIITVLFIGIRQYKIRSKYLALFGLLFLTGLYLVSLLSGEGAHLTRTATIESRLVNYQEALNTWKKQPIFGIGYNHIRYSREASPNISTVDMSHADAAYHSSFLVILVTGGIIGLILFAGALFELSRMSMYALYGVLFVSIASITDNVLLHPFVLFLLLTFIAHSAIRLSDN